MLVLKTTPFADVQKWFCDFQKHSKCFEMPPDEGEIVGIYLDTELIGYFILVGYDNEYVEVNQGYLKPAYRHKALPNDCIKLMEEGCRKAGYKEIKLGTHNRFQSYLRFMKQNGYKPEHLIFSKKLEG